MKVHPAYIALLLTATPALADEPRRPAPAGVDAPRPPAAPPVMVRVHIETSGHAVLQRRLGDGWLDVCDDPCDQLLPRDDRYRIIGTTEELSFANSPPGSTVIVNASMPNVMGEVGGIFLLVVSAVAIVAGGVLLTMGAGDGGTNKAATAEGLVAVGGGLLGILGGALILETSRKTTASTELSTRAPTPAFFEHATSWQLPLMHSPLSFTHTF